MLRDCKISFFQDRAGDIISTVDIGHADKHTVECWSRYLGVEELELSCDKHGRVVTPIEVQLQFALSMVKRIVDEILCDSRRRDLALQFINGYNTAYTDWASGKWAID